jgi:hypothetical protein
LSPLGSPPTDLSNFPVADVASGASLWRIHPRQYDPIWFGSDGRSRFDLAAPEGTCYLAEDPLGAFVEVFRDTTTLASGDLALRRITQWRVLRDIRLADCSHRLARSFGVTAALHSSPDYRVTQDWARAFAAAGFDGIRYLVSHDPAQKLAGVALFGAAGEPADNGEFGSLDSANIDDTLIDRAVKELGFKVIPSSP